MNNEIENQILKISINTSLELNDTKIKNVNFVNKKTRDYCPVCKQDTTFTHYILYNKIQRPHYDKFGNYMYTESIVNVEPINTLNEIVHFYIAVCSMNDKHKIFYAFSLNEKRLFKFAEYPYDLVKMKVPAPKGKIVKRIGIDNYFIQAYSAAQNNLWIGAYVYIRKILEKIIDYVHKQNNEEIKNWNKKMLGEKIECVKKILPNYVKNNVKKLSSVLSDTIHNLEENEANKNYNLVFEIINLILNKIETDIETKKREEKATKQLNSIASKNNVQLLLLSVNFKLLTKIYSKISSSLVLG